MTQADFKPPAASSTASGSPEPLAASLSALETQPAPASSNSRDREAGTRDRLRGPRERSRGWIWRSTLCLCVVAVVAGYGGLSAMRRGETNPEEIWKQAEAALQTGKLDAVDAAVEQLGRLRKPNPSDWFLRGRLAVARQHPDEAIELLARVPDHDGQAARARLLAGQTELRRSRVRYAEEWLIAATRLDPRLAQAHRELIYIYATQLRRAELNAEFTALAELTNLSFDNAFHWALLRSNSWEPGKEIDGLSRYIEADPGDRWSRLALAENYRRMGRTDDAEATLAALSPAEPEVIDLQARIALDRHAADEAERLVASGAKDDPLLARLRGRLALARGDAKSAVGFFRIALGADRLNRETLFGLAAALELSGDSKAALAYRETAARLDRFNSLIQRAAGRGARTDIDLMRELGAACAALSLDDEARAWYKLAIGLNPLDSESQEGLYRLKNRRGTVDVAP